MPEAITFPEPDGIHYHPEELPGDRGQLAADVVTGGHRGTA